MKSGLFTFITCLFAISSFGQYWKKVDEKSLQLRNITDREIIPSKYEIFSLALDDIKVILNEAPMEFSPEFSKSGKPFMIPLPDGKLEEFMVWKAPVMEEALAIKYPSINTFKGFQKSNPSTSIRFSIGPNGFHGAIKDGENMIYIDPYSVSNHDIYTVYHTSDHIDETLKDKVICGTDDAIVAAHKGPKWGTRNFDEKMDLRVYRLALACTGEWGALRGTKEKALSDMVTFIERANIIFESELALRLVLIANNDVLINLDGTTDQYTNPEAGLSILGQNTNIISGKVGFGNYEIGHVFSICFDVGGVAGGNICTPAKGAGVTCHNNQQISNGIVLVFNHEVGHQMTASHTFNNCPGQEGQSTSFGYEPGSGSTIMAYPGACGPSNLGVPRDNYYHVATLDQILSYTNSVGAEAYNCAQKIDIDNYIPVIDMPYEDGFFIPKSTPFYLKASATDANNDKMTYNWDQFDAQGSSPLGSPVGNAPIFRSIKHTTNPARYFPNVTRILNGDFTNVQELLPTYGRDLTFRFVVRDNNPLGSAAVWEEVKFKVASGDVGPFKLTFPTNEQKLIVGEKLDVTWDVANTDKAPVNCKYVDIYVALNNSLDFDSDRLIKIAESVPNDGLETVIIPNTPSTSARIVVKAANNIFFSTGLRNSRIDLPTVPSFIVNVSEPNRAVCLPENVDFEFSSAGFAGLSEEIKFEVVSGLPNNAIATFSKNAIFAGETTTLNLDFSDVVGTAVYEIVVRSYVIGIDTIERKLRLNLTSTQLDDIDLISPANSLSGVGPTQKYNWKPKSDANLYEHQVSTSPSFESNKIVLSSITKDTFFNSNTFLEKSTIYFWRVRSSNDCKIGEWSEVYAFNTESLKCEVAKSGSLSINISQSGTPTISTDLYVNADALVNDVNVKNIRANHQWASDIVAYLVAPSGKEALLWSRKCSTGNGINVGLDDQSNEFFQCPISTGKIYRPESPLSVFNGESMRGNWTLRLEDKATGNGGRLLNFDLELCANIALNPPYLVRNEMLTVLAKDSKTINNDLLLAQDSDNSALELTYTLVSAPKYGILSLNGSPVLVGNKFTQEDLNQSKIQYLHTGTNENADSFKFIISDGQGGWVSITDFSILIDLSSSTKDQYLTERIMVYPNPAGELINIKAIDEGITISQCIITDITGREVLSTDRPENVFNIDVSNLTTGVYTIRIHTEKQIINKKIVKR
jgi:subtilisin-like proprotein convertase family protein